jgi:hypothetical protein
MPTKDQHIQKANLNEDFGQAIYKLDLKFGCWIVVAYYYAALHWIDAYIDNRSGYHPPNHANRESYISKDSNLRNSIYNDYRDIKDDSRLARYGIGIFNDSRIEYNRQILEKLKTTIQGFLKL